MMTVPKKDSWKKSSKKLSFEERRSKSRITVFM